MNECSQLLLTYKERVQLVRTELERVVHQTDGFFSRQMLRVMKGSLASKVLDNCQAAGACNAQDFIVATNDAIEHLFHRGHKIRTYSKLIAINIGIGAATAFTTSKLPAEIQSLTTFITVFVSNAAWEFIAPIAEPSLGKLRQNVFRSVRRDAVADVANSEQHGRLEGIARDAQAHLTPWAQHGRSIVNGFLSTLLQHTYGAHQAMVLYPDRAKALAFAADQLASTMYYMRTVFKDLPPDSAEIAHEVRTSLIDHIEDPGALAAAALARVKQRDPEAASSDVAAYYDAVVKSWFGL